MIVVKGSSWPLGAKRNFIPQCFALNTAGTGKRTTWWFAVPDDSFVAQSTDKRRLPGEYLIQGNTFDGYGNKSVANEQWTIALDGTDWAPLNPGGLSVPGIQKVSTYETNYCLTTPSVVRCDNPPWSAVDRIIIEGPATLLTVNVSSSTAWKTQVEVVPCPESTDGEQTYAVVYRQSCCHFGKYSGKFYYDKWQQAVAVSSSDSYSGTGLVSPQNARTYADKAYVGQYLGHQANLLKVASDLELCEYTIPWGQIKTRRPTEISQSLADISSPSASSLDDATIRKWQSHANLMMTVMPSETESDRSELAHDVMSQINMFDSNTIAYAKDLSDTGSTIRSFVQAVGDVKNPKQWASAWLSGRFGDRLTISDTMAAIDAFKRWAGDVGHGLNVYRSTLNRSGQGSFAGCPYDWSRRTVASVGLSAGLTGDLENILAAPYRYDFGLTLGNTWDLIPFSFVVDWIVSIGDILDTIDLMNETRFLDIKTEYASRLEKFCCALPEGVSGTIEVKRYTRGPAPVSSWLRLKSFSESLLTSARPVNMIDGAALLVQNRC